MNLTKLDLILDPEIRVLLNKSKSSWQLATEVPPAQLSHTFSVQVCTDHLITSSTISPSGLAIYMNAIPLPLQSYIFSIFCGGGEEILIVLKKTDYHQNAIRTSHRKACP